MGGWLCVVPCATVGAVGRVGLVRVRGLAGLVAVGEASDPLMADRGVHWSTGSLTSMMHREKDCIKTRGRKIYPRIDSDGGMGWLWEQRWCSVCSPHDHARAAAAKVEFERQHPPWSR